MSSTRDMYVHYRTGRRLYVVNLAREARRDPVTKCHRWVGSRRRLETAIILRTASAPGAVECRGWNRKTVAVENMAGT